MEFASPKVSARKRVKKYSLVGGIFAVLSLASTIIFLLGCLSPSLRDLGIYRVDVVQLADELLKLSAESNVTNADLVHPSLPQYWYFGYSGICDFFTSSSRISASGETQCRYGFPPDQNVLSVVEGSMRTAVAANGSVTEKAIKTVVSAWGEVLDEVPASKLRDKESKVASQNKAVCALAILAMLLDVTAWILAFLLGEKHFGRMAAYLVACCSAVFAVAAGACAVLSMNEGMHGVISDVGNVSGSLVFLFLGALLRVPAVGGLLPREIKLSRVVLGELGESFVYEWCRKRIPDFSGEKHWSSKIYPLREQGEYADFDYLDHEGYMSEALRGAGVPMMPNWGVGTLYQLEVKSTQGKCNLQPMMLSPNQVNKIKGYNIDSRQAYIIVRVFRVGSERIGVRFFPRPWESVLRGELQLGEPNADGNYPLFIMR
ncbi:hypothetical protein QBC47DRAFT_374194 [Echria macrotheca]|uniref:Uncharacterized protein n=1 Tax=Echria macrotheca TaxID=438768 RepID=A0AAJ0BJG7_9PEZI|nr:hypothetical protein QBC47DRAFT_374194 [Echria macrotheca]